MVDSKTLEQIQAQMPDTITDEEFEAFMAKQPKRSREEAEAEVEEFLNHPLHCKELTPEAMERPEFQALQAMAYEGDKKEVAENFLNHGLEQLQKVLLETTKYKEKDLQESLYCFNQGIDQKCGDKKIEFALLMGRAKLNLCRHNFGHCKNDCLDALKVKQNEQIWFILIRSRYFVEKYDECLKYAKEALVKYPNSIKIKELAAKCEVELAKEKETMRQIQLINQGKDDEKLKVFRCLRANKVKLGKQVHNLPQIVDQSITIDKKGKLHFPVLILYDEFMQTDFIQNWTEDETFASQLRPLFQSQAPWDREGVYRMDTIEVYFECDQTKPLDPKEAPKVKSTKKYCRVNLKETLLSALQNEHHIVPQYPVFKVISKENDDFRDMFLGEI